MGTRLFAAALLVYAACPPFTSNDSWFTVPTALSLLRHGATAIDEYVPGAPRAAMYAAQRVGGHWQNYYPHAVSVLALPVVAALRAAVALVPRPAARVARPEIAAFLSGDFVGGHVVVELLCASFFGALAVWLQYRIARRLVPERQALAVTLLFAFGTAEWSIGSRNLMQHGLSILLLNVAIYLVLVARDQPRIIAWTAVPLALSFTVRPSNAIAVAVFTVYVGAHYRSEFPRFIALATPVAAVFFLHNWFTFHRWIPAYFTTPPTRCPPLFGFAMNFVSPARGLFVYTPVFLFSGVGVWMAIRGRWLFPFAPYAAAVLVLHTALIATFWPGHCYGPRYFSDMTPLLVLFLVPAILRWRKLAGGARRWAACAFAAAALWGVFVNWRGATSAAVHEWNRAPVSVDDARDRVWDWSDPTFLRGLR